MKQEGKFITGKIPAIPLSKDKILFTPGPLMTSTTVKMAMMRDLGSRDYEFKVILQEIKSKLLDIANVKRGEYEVVLMQGSDTFGLESVIGSTIPHNGKLLAIVNGAYGARIAEMAKILGVNTQVAAYRENTTPDPDHIDKLLRKDPSITNVSVVHCETSSGIMNPIREIGEVVKRHDKIYFVNGIISFGGVPINFQKCNIDYLVAGANKSLEGVPGFSIIFAKTDVLKKTKGYRRSLSLDLYAQWEELEENNEFRFTPPIHTMLALNQALKELEMEGGIEGRAARYKANCKVLIPGMRKMGFREYLFPNLRSYIITSYLDHDHPNYSFDKFYDLLNEKDQIVYPWKLSSWNGFRVGTIGRIYPSDMKILLNAIHESLLEMGVKVN